jgi:putative DNA primase/helicase
LPAVDLARWLDRRRDREPAARLDPPRALVQAANGSPSVPSRAASYLGKLPPAVSGEGGHGRTFHAACVLIKGFGLSVDQARPLLEDWNRSCVPPWSAAELEHKLKSADKAPDDRPRGYLGGPGRRTRRGTRQGRRAAPSAPSSPSTADRAPDCDVATDEVEVAIEGSETNPQRLAVLFLSQRFTHAGCVGLRFWRDQFHIWENGVYRIASSAELRAQLSQCLADEFRRVHNVRLAAAEVDDRDRGPGRPRRPLAPIPVSTRLIGDVVQALSGLVLVRGDQCGSQPGWIDAVPEAVARDPYWRRPAVVAVEVEVEAKARSSSTFADRQCDLSHWPADALIPARNALVHPPSLLTGARCAMPPTPRFFNAHALDYDFDPHAPSPAVWLDFLRRLWPDDPTSIDCLQEWFGYLMTADTGLQKILMMIGPKRSGRGTIGRVLKALAGPSNVVNPTLSTLARPFGPSVLIDKPVAIFPDARLSSRPDNAMIVESLLSISGEDDQSIDRKHLPSWTGRLPTRFVLISNELPRLKDSSGALAGRLVVLRFTRSFYNREDATLSDRIKRELPGILLWALDGWQRLRRRGRFIQPDSARDLLSSMDELASPITAFLNDCCVLEADATTPTITLYEAWREWCREHGRDAVGDAQGFGRDLHAAISGLVKSRPRINSERTQHYSGIRLRTALDSDPP